MGLACRLPTWLNKRGQAMVKRTSGGTLSPDAFTALLEAQKARDAILQVLGGMEDKMHAHGLSGGIWAIEAILEALASRVDLVIDEHQSAQAGAAPARSAQDGGSQCLMTTT